MNKTRKRIHRIVALLFTVVLCLSIITPVASARGSKYIGNYIYEMTSDGSGIVTVWASITGVDTMDQIGAIKVVIYENGVKVKTYQHTDTAGMMGYNKYYHSFHISYQGVVGRSYSAFITYQCGRDGGYDNRSVDTNTVTAIN